MSGPLKGLKVIEFGGIGPGPFCAMMLSDMGADVIRLDRKADKGKDRGEGAFLASGRRGVLHRGRRSVAVDLKDPQDKEKVLQLIDGADAIIEGYRPGVMERLGLGPDVLLARHPRLVYGRMTGWGQDGPMAQAAGHDINYIALSGALSTIGRAQGGPVAPPAMVGDLGGGGMMLAFGIVCALLEARNSGKGQVVDAAIVDGAALLTSIVCDLKALGLWQNKLQSNLLDGGAHFYDTYECADGQWISIGSLEPQFYTMLLEKLGITDPDFALSRQRDPAAWPGLKRKIADIFRSQPSSHWRALLEGTDVCFAPVLTLEEAAQHPHNRARGTFFEREGILQPAPAPRFSRTVPGQPGPSPYIGEHDDEILK
ncbi:CaiB/BaiF CoA transferase family protein [Extensimonas perlucida]|uniref:CaiB/BaiF CoA transferase family protein n=1 Tax=Extensimonas perlucida TaxID=2590786 RepID=UPI00119D4E4C|nr:CaiB/BaiF CoA-transferase family protein [Extensimonas perlucida]